MYLLYSDKNYYGLRYVRFRCPKTITDKNSALAEMGDRGHNRHGPKRGGAAVPLSRRAGTPSIQCGRNVVYYRTTWRLHLSSRLAT